MRSTNKFRNYSSFRNTTFTVKYEVKFVDIIIISEQPTAWIAASTCRSSVKRFIIHCTHIRYSFRCAQKACCIVRHVCVCVRVCRPAAQKEACLVPADQTQCQAKVEEMWPMRVRVQTRIMLNIFVAIVVAASDADALFTSFMRSIFSLSSCWFNSRGNAFYSRVFVWKMYSNSNQDFCPLMLLSFLSVPLLFLGGAELHSVFGDCAKSGCTWPNNGLAFRCRHKWHCNIISVENTSKCNPALHVFVRRAGTRWVGTHTSTPKHTKIHTNTHKHTQIHTRAIAVVS